MHPQPHLQASPLRPVPAPLTRPCIGHNYSPRHPVLPVAGGPNPPEVTESFLKSTLHLLSVVNKRSSLLGLWPQPEQYESRITDILQKAPSCVRLAYILRLTREGVTLRDWQLFCVSQGSWEGVIV